MEHGSTVGAAEQGRDRKKDRNINVFEEAKMANKTKQDITS